MRDIAAGSLAIIEELVPLSNSKLQGQEARDVADNANATLLVITPTVKGKPLDAIDRIGTERTLQVVMNGRSIEQITPGVITRERALALG